jgi:hypothetical protein
MDNFMTREKVEQNLKAARAAMVGSGPDLAHAAETDASMCLLILKLAAEADAADFNALDKRRRELLSRLRVYSEAGFFLGGQMRPVYPSRAVSAALVADALPEAPEDAARAAETWQSRLDAIVRDDECLEGQS